MALTYVDGGGSGLLGTLGGLATIGGALTGQPWLTGLGTAMGTADRMMNGGGGGSGGQVASGENGANTLLGVLSELFNKKKNNPASGNIAKINTELSTADENDILKNWSRSYNPYLAGSYYGRGF